MAKSIFPLLVCEDSMSRRARPAVIVIKYQAEPDVANKSPIAINHRTRINEARWCQLDSGEDISLQFSLPLSRHCSQMAKCATISHQGFQDQKPDLSGQAVPG